MREFFFEDVSLRGRIFLAFLSREWDFRWPGSPDPCEAAVEYAGRSCSRIGGRSISKRLAEMRLRGEGNY